MPSADPDPLDPAQRRSLLALARESIEHGFHRECPLPVVPSDYSTDLTAHRASFVSLHTRGTLCGCIGHLEAVRPLVSDVAENAFAAAFRDPRFPPLAYPKLVRLSIEISVLTPPQSLAVTSEEELLRIIEPGRDGLIFEDGAACGTFLPMVWDSLPDPHDFLCYLKRKAGLGPDHWSDRTRIRRYRTESFSE